MEYDNLQELRTRWLDYCGIMGYSPDEYTMKEFEYDLTHEQDDLAYYGYV